MIKKCPDCGGMFEEGAMVDFTYGGILVQRHAKASIPKEIKPNFAYETKFENIRRVVTYRCISCNRLFPYAQDFILGKTLWQANKGSLYSGIFMGIILVVLALLIVFFAGGFRR